MPRTWRSTVLNREVGANDLPLLSETDLEKLFLEMSEAESPDPWLFAWCMGERVRRRHEQREGFLKQRVNSLLDHIKCRDAQDRALCALLEQEIGPKRTRELVTTATREVYA